MKHLFRYLKGITTYSLKFGGEDLSMNDLKLQTYIDASFADDPLIRYLTGAYMVFLAGSPVL